MSRHIVILGGGVIGLCTAWYCAGRGHRVTVIDRNPAVRDGCSFGNAGMIVPSHFVPLAAPGMVALGLKWMWNPESPFYIEPRLDAGLLSWGWRFWRACTRERVERAAPLLRDLNLASRAEFARLAAIPGNDFGLVQQGLLMLCQSKHTLAEEAAMAARSVQLGIPAEVLDARQTARLDPGAALNIEGSVYFPKDCHLSPGAFMAGLQRLLAERGVEFRWSEAWVGWRASGRVIQGVETRGGVVTGDEYVVCGGAWSPLLARDLGVSIPIQAGKGYSLTLPAPRQLPRLCSILTEARVAVTPMGSSLRFGGTMELAGLNESIRPARVRSIIRAACSYYPGFVPADFEGVEPWRGLRPCSPDGLPYVGRFRAYDNLSVATGHAMMGLSLGPITGRLMSEILSGEPPSLAIGLLDPDRYL